MASILPYDLCKHCDLLFISDKNKKIKEAYKEKKWNIDQYIDIRHERLPNLIMSNNGHYFAYSFLQKYTFKHEHCMYLVKILDNRCSEMSHLKNKEFIHFCPDSTYYIVEHPQGATLNYFSSPLSEKNPYLIANDNPCLMTKYHTLLGLAKDIVISNNNKYILLPKRGNPCDYYELWAIDAQGMPQEIPLKNKYGHHLLRTFGGAVMFHPDNQHIMYNDHAAQLQLYNIETEQQKLITQREPGYSGNVSYLKDPVITPDNKKLLLKGKSDSYNKHNHLLFNIETVDTTIKSVIIPQQSCHQKQRPEESDLPILYIPHNNMLTHITDEGNTLNLLNENAQVVATHKAEKGTYITVLAVSSTGYYLAAGYSDGTIMIWNLFSKNPEYYEKIFMKNDGAITSLTFGDNQLLLSQSASHIIKWEYQDTIKYQYGSAIVWDIHGNKIIDFGDNILKSIMSPNGKTIALVSIPNTKSLYQDRVSLSSYTLDENMLQNLCNEKNELTLAQLYDLIHATTNC
jgi:WD40 repeat protein